MLSLKTFYRVFIKYLQNKNNIRLPFFCTWYVTSRCNLCCKGCFYFSRFPQPDTELTTKECLKVVHQINIIGIPFLIFCGGEPFLRKDIFDIAKEAKKLAIYTSIFTNGHLITPEIAKMIPKCFNCIFFSLDGSKEEHNKIKGNNSYEKTLNGIKTLFVVKKSINVYVNFVINKYNYKNLKQTLMDLKSIGVNKVKIQPNFNLELQPQENEILEAIDEINELKSEFPTFIMGDKEYFDNMRNLKKKRCNYEVEKLQNIAILPNGDVSACCIYPIILGSLKEKSLSEILHKNGSSFNCFEKKLNCEGCYRNDYRTINYFLSTPLTKMVYEYLGRIKGL